MSDSTERRDGCTAGWCADEEWCAVTCGAAVLRNKWHPVVVHRLLEAGPMGFADLKRELGAVSNKTLSETLDDLEAERVVDREVVAEKPVRVQYSLTDHGRDLEPVVDALEAWGRAHRDVGDARGGR